MKILHFSDIHLGQPRHGLAWLFDKRILGTATHHFRRAPKQHLHSIDSLVKVVQELAPDVILCTGDLTTVAAPEEFQAVSARLRPIVERVSKAFFLPGNHDRYVANRDSVEALRSVAELFTPHEMTASCGLARFYFLDAAVSRPVWSSAGVVSQDQLEHLDALLAAPRIPHEVRILVSHFPIFNHRGAAPGRMHGLLNSQRLRDWASQSRFDYCLCGHVHHPYIYQSKSFTQLCSGSLTLADSYTLLSIQSDGTTQYTIHNL